MGVGVIHAVIEFFFFFARTSYQWLSVDGCSVIAEHPGLLSLGVQSLFAHCLLKLGPETLF